MPLPHSGLHLTYGNNYNYTGGSGPVSPPAPDTGAISSITPSTTTVNEGNSVTFTVATSNISDGTSISWEVVVGGNAYPAATITPNNDFSTATSGTTTVTSNSAQFTVGAAADLTTEGFEQFRVRVTYSGTGSTVTSSYITINDTSQTPATPTIISVTPQGGATSTVEGNTRTFDVVTSAIPDSTSLNWAVNHIGTTSADFTTSFGTVTITSNSGSFNVPIASDATNEGTEEYTITVSGTVSATAVSKTTGSQYIVDASSPRIDGLSVSSSSVEEGTNLNVIVDTLDYPDGNKVFNWAVSHVSTIAQDFDTTSSTVTVNTSSGSGTGNFNVPIRADTVANEGSETFRVTVTDPVTPSINAQTILVTIVDKTPRIVSVTGPTTITEAGTGNYFTYNVTTENIPNGTTLDWDVNHGTTVVGDFGGNGQFGTFTVNNNAGSFQIDIDQDETTEGDETFTLTASGTVAHPNDGSVNVSVSATTGTITITDTSTEPSISISSTPTQANETNLNSRTWTITTAGFDEGDTLNWIINHGSTSAADFSASSGTTSAISGGSCTMTIVVDEDFTTEGDETFTFTVSGTSSGGASVSETSHTVTIFDTSQTPSISSVSGPSSIDEGSSGDFDITCVNVPNGTSLTWQIQTTSGTAPPLTGSGLAADDFNSATVSGTVTVNNNTATVTVYPYADATTEGSEVFKLFVYGTAGPNSTSINGTSGNCTINDTSQPTASMDSSFSITGGFQSESGSAGFVEAYITFQIDHEPSNNRIKIESHRGGSQTQAIIITDYVDYTGLSNITSLDVKYNVSSHSCIGTCYSGGAFGPLPTNDGFSTNTYYSVPTTPGAREFGWMAKANPNLGNNSTAVDASDVELTIRLIDSVAGTFTATSNSVDIDLNASVGSSPQV